MAKQQKFADKNKKKLAPKSVKVKVIKTIKTSKGTYKFSEKLVSLDDLKQLEDLKNE